jgi:MinD-like ATPase involved in chromosome partitioning or flagellar assembly
VAVSAVRRAFGGLRQITVVNPKGGAGKTVATLMLGLTFGQARGGFVLAWDNNETQGTLGMRAQPDIHPRTVRDLLHDLDRFGNGQGRIGELAAYVRGQEEAMFDVLASDEAATAGEMLTARAFRDIRDVVGRFYKLILVDTGNNVRAENWQASVDATDQLIITMSARNDSAETAARLLDHLEQTGRRELVHRAVAVVTMPPHRKEVDPRPIEQHFDAAAGRSCGSRTTGTSTRARRSATPACHPRAAGPGCESPPPPPTGCDPAARNQLGYLGVS